MEKKKTSSFKFNKAMTKQKVFTGGDHIDTSGCYKVMITDAEIQIGSKADPKSKSEALVLSVQRPKAEGAQTAKYLRINYLQKDGEMQEQGYATVSQLVELTGNADNMDDFPNCLKKSVVGIFLEVKLGEYKGQPQQQKEIRGFYDAKSKLTTHEECEGLEHETYDAFEERFKDAQPVAYVKSGTTRTAEQAVEDKKNAPKNNQQEESDDDEFPF